ncbi:MAG: hypothetical protein AB1726_01230 [Planctomycetota bacterium]
MTVRRLVLASVVLSALGFTVYALATPGGSPAAPTSPRAAQPAAETPSAAFLVLQERAKAPPRGALSSAEIPAVPAIASPAR